MSWDSFEQRTTYAERRPSTCTSTAPVPLCRRYTQLLHPSCVPPECASACPSLHRGISSVVTLARVRTTVWSVWGWEHPINQFGGEEPFFVPLDFFVVLLGARHDHTPQSRGTHHCPGSLPLAPAVHVLCLPQTAAPAGVAVYVAQHHCAAWQERSLPACAGPSWYSGR